MIPSLDRPLDRAEAFFWMLDRCSSMNFAVMAEGRGELPPEALATALARAQAVHPALGCAIRAGPSGTLAFVPAPGHAVPLAQGPGDDDWRQPLVREMVRPFALGEAPLVRARLVTLPGGRWVLSLVFHHAIADGRSGLRLLAEVVDEAMGGPAQSGAGGARPSFFSRFPEAYAGAAGLEKAAAWRASLKRDSPGRPGPVPGFACDGGGILPGIATFALEAEAVARLAAKARAEGATVHGALGAAELLAVRTRYGEGAPLLTLTSPVDLRDHLAEPMDDATPGFYVTLLSSTAPVRADEDFWGLARHLASDLRRQRDAGHGHLFYHLVPPAETIPPVPEAEEGFRAYMRKMPPACALSNVGRIAQPPERDAARLDNLSFALCPMAHQALFVAASTCRGRLTVNVVHDEARLPAGIARPIAEAMRARLEAASA